MEDYETIKKFFTDKEIENIQLKEELDNLKKKLSSLNEDKSTNSQDKNKSHFQDINSSYIGMYFDHNTSRMVDDFSLKNDLSSRSLKRSKSNNTRIAKDIQLNIGDDLLKFETPGKDISLQNPQQSQKSIQTLNDPNEEFVKILNSLDLGRLIDDKPSTTNLLFSNKNAIKSIEHSISALRSEITTYEKNYENINDNLKTTLRDPEIIQNKKTEYVVEELMSKIKLKEQEMNQLKEFYENELKLKTEIYNQNVTHLNRTHQEEMRKTRIDYENKMDELIKKSEEEKIQLMKKISQLEKNSLIITSKQDVNEKNELIEFQKKYLNEMKDLQKNFENFKNKTYKEFKNLKKSKSEATEKANFYKDQIEKLRSQNEINKENFFKMQKFYEESKKVMKTNHILLNELEMSKAEVVFLKTKLAKLENVISSKRIHEDAENNIKLRNLDMNIIYHDGIDNKKQIFSNKSSDYESSGLKEATNTKSAKNLKNINIFSQPGSTRIISGFNLKNTNTPNPVNTNTSIHNAEEEFQTRTLEIQNAHQKMKEIEDYLYEMNNDNNSTKAKATYQSGNNVNLETQQSDYDLNRDFNPYSSNTNKSMRNTMNIDNNRLNTNNMLSNYQNYHSLSIPHNYRDNYLHINEKYNTLSHNYKKDNSNIENKLRQSINYSAEIIDDSSNSKEDSGNKKSANEVLSHSAIIVRGKSKGREEITPTMQKSCVIIHRNPKASDAKLINLKSKSNNFNLNVASNSNNNIKVYESGDMKFDDEDSNLYEEEPQESCDDNIIEFPLQLKIKGKIKKISTVLEKRNNV